mgnify:FL=1|tara:strand:+ start:14401 stop:15411 length:1011 start_codon:yes stop_codon:yes gene_type:complete
MHVKIIAECGVNHNGSLSLAKKMIDKASSIGADYVKFQSFNASELANENLKKATYQKINSKSSESQFKMLKKLEISEDFHKKIIKYSSQKKIKFLSSPFDITSLNMLLRLGIKIIKIPSGEINNYPLLLEISKKSKEVILSTGMANNREISNALKILLSHNLKRGQITILQCTSDYPTNYKDVNLRVMNEFKKKYRTNIGLSDHTIGTEVAIAATALGASMIEKHFTLNKNMSGPDHFISSDPVEFKKMVFGIRNIELALGSNTKTISKSELKTKKVVRKFIIAKKDILKGEIFSLYNLTSQRTGSGIEANYFKKLLKKKSKINYKKGQKILKCEI